jgi:predicted short-subunit dehydrogenase-like oxidoreductase (DUF2520 family)
MQSVSIVGIGRVGGALALALANAGYKIDYLVHRDRATAELISSRLPGTVRLVASGSFPDIASEILLITTADPDIRNVAVEAASHLKNRPAVFHTSGSLSSDVLSDLRPVVGSIGSIHPLVSISDPLSGSASFANAYFCIEGDEAAGNVARSIVKALGGIPFSIESKYKSLYHAAAVTACGHLVALIDVAIEMLTECGVDPESAKKVLLPLIKSTIGNLETQTPEAALTGSFARADVDAFNRHLASLAGVRSPAMRDIYLLLGERSLDLAAANGADPADLKKLRESISMAKRKPE